MYAMYKTNKVNKWYISMKGIESYREQPTWLSNVQT